VRWSSEAAITVRNGCSLATIYQKRMFWIFLGDEGINVQKKQTLTHLHYPGSGGGFAIGSGNKKYDSAPNPEEKTTL